MGEGCEQHRRFAAPSSLSSQLDQNSEPNTRNNLSSKCKSSSMSSRSSSPRRRSDGNPEARFFSPFHAETSTCLQLFGGCCPSPVPRGMGKHVLCGMCDLIRRRGWLEGNALVFCLGFWEKGGLPQSVSNRWTVIGIERKQHRQKSCHSRCTIACNFWTLCNPGGRLCMLKKMLRNGIKDIIILGKETGTWLTAVPSPFNIRQGRTWCPRQRNFWQENNLARLPALKSKQKRWN